MLKRKKFWPIFACGLAFFIWGLNAPMIETGLKSVPIGPLLFAKFALGGVFFTLLARRNWKKIPAKATRRIIISTIIGYALTNFLFYEGVRLTGGLNASLIYLLAPLVLYFLSIEVLRERFNSRLLFGLSVGFVGATLIVGAPLLNGDGAAMHFYGNLLILATILADVAGIVLIKPVLGKIPVMQITAIRFNIAAIAVLPFVYTQLGEVKLNHLSNEAVIALSYNLLIATLLGYFLYHWGLRKIKGEEMSPLQYLDPVAGVAGSMILLGAEMTTTMIIGVGLVVIGLYYGEFSKHSPLHAPRHR